MSALPQPVPAPSKPIKPARPKTKSAAFHPDNISKAAPDREDLAEIESAMSTIASLVSPDWIIGAASNKQGHSSRIWVNITPELAGLLETLIQSGVCPAFRSRADAARAGIWFVVKMLAYWQSGHSDQVNSLVVQHTIVEKLIKEEQNRIDFEKTFNDLRLVINHHIGSGHFQHAKQLVDAIREQINIMPAGHWRAQYQKKILEFDSLFGNHKG